MATAVSADQVKRLRDQTGAGMMDCKAALAEANGDFEQATRLLRKKGLASAAKRTGRATSEGVIGSWLSDDRTRGVLVEVNCESDFVARTEDFRQLVKDVLTEIERKGDPATPSWLKDANGPIQQRVAQAIGKLGENMAVPRFVRFAGKGHVGQYIHQGGKVGVLVEFTGATAEIAQRDEFKTLVKEIAMQIAAASPAVAAYVSRQEVPRDVLENERAIYRAQMENSGKPENVIDKIVEGKLGGFYSQVVLLDQPYMRDPKMTVAQLVASATKSLGAPIQISRFTRFKVGEHAE